MTRIGKAMRSSGGVKVSSPFQTSWRIQRGAASQKDRASTAAAQIVFAVDAVVAIALEEVAHLLLCPPIFCGKFATQEPLE